MYKASLAIEDLLSDLVMRRQAAKRIRRFQAPYKLNLGCGQAKIVGWINIDLAPIGDLQWDLTKGLPFADQSCSFIYSEHVLEHLTPSEAAALLVECHRVLIKRGILRIAMPSLEHIARKYFSADWRDQEWLKQQYGFIETPAEMLNFALRSWGHKWLYDEVELRRRLEDAGFHTVRSARFGDSGVPELRGLETRPDSLLICEAIS